MLNSDDGNSIAQLDEAAVASGPGRGTDSGTAASINTREKSELPEEPARELANSRQEKKQITKIQNAMASAGGDGKTAASANIMARRQFWRWRHEGQLAKNQRTMASADGDGKTAASADIMA